MVIGVFDSGVGGLSVALPLRQVLPNADLIYLADAAFAPYGEKSQPAIRDRLLRIVTWFHDRDVRLLVIACNTATVNAIDDLRLAFPKMTFVGIEPAVKPAAAVCDRIVVLGTESTVHNARYHELVKRWGNGPTSPSARAGRSTTIWHRGANDLVRQVESGDLVSADRIKAHLDALPGEPDGLVIGCTHFSFFIPTIQQHWPHLQIFDGAAGVVRRTLDVLGSTLRVQPRGGWTEWLTTGPDRLVRFTEFPIQFRHVDLIE
ncbi:glutamate racemase [Candidatus Berkelbacteria bacterium]|nr:glutamate racemase [Candidatus Berkelbacteria bacterium]